MYVIKFYFYAKRYSYSANIVNKTIIIKYYLYSRLLLSFMSCPYEDSCNTRIPYITKYMYLKY